MLFRSGEILNLIKSHVWGVLFAWDVIFTVALIPLSLPGLQILYTLLQNVAQEEAAAQSFYQTYFCDILQHIFSVVTDTSHTAGELGDRGGGAPGRGGRKGHEARLWSCMRFLCLKYIHTFSISEERRHGRAFRMEQPPWISFQQHVTAIPQLCYAPFIYIYMKGKQKD